MSAFSMTTKISVRQQFRVVLRIVGFRALLLSALQVVAITQSHGSTNQVVTVPVPPPVVINPGGTNTLYLSSSGIAGTVFRLPASDFIRSNIMVMSGGRLIVHFDGTEPGTNYYRIIATNLAVYVGSFNFLVTNGFSPQLGQVFEPLHYSNRLGEFSNVFMSGLSNGLGCRLSYGSNSVKLTVVPVEDPPKLEVTPTQMESGFTFKLDGVLGEDYVIEGATTVTNWVPVYTNSPHQGRTELGVEVGDLDATFFRAFRLTP